MQTGMSRGQGMALGRAAGMLWVVCFLEGPGLSRSQGWGQSQVLWAWLLRIPGLWTPARCILFSFGHRSLHGCDFQTNT